MARITVSSGFDCECGEHHAFSGWVAAHWDEELSHTCNKCGRKHTLKSGFITLDKSNPKILKIKTGRNGR